MPVRNYFPRAVAYPGTSPPAGTVREAPARFRRFPWSERHLQCVWFDPVLRPAGLVTSEGESVEVEDPGQWNLDAGPDFIGAALRVGEGRRRVCGDIEIHTHPQAWRTHGHAGDPRYERVCAHVTFFDGELGARELPRGAVQIALKGPLGADAPVVLDAVDLTAYPFASRAVEPPCQRVLRTWSVSEKERLLDAAGQERMRRKAARLALRIEETGAGQTLYEETCAALGYKHNKPAFRSLATRVPLAILQQAGESDPLAATALLYGVAGLLPDRLMPRWDEETRVYVRALWDRWFKQRNQWAGRILGPGAWRLSGLRPANHPARRIAAAARLFVASGELVPLIVNAPGANADVLVRKAERLFAAARDAYWDRRYGWGGARTPRAVALAGDERIRLWTVNVLLPFLAAHGRVATLPPTLLDELPPEGDNQIVRQAAANLFGPHHPASWHRSGPRRQGLIQIFHDYCLNDRSRCASCPFPGLLRDHRPHSAELPA